jgi:phosphatidylserine/phosphatidylglycerophosphate/cardiolipin synthase-like enzyme
VVDALDHAKNSVFVQAYSFTSAPIAKALVDAHKRGVKVQVILDKSNRTEKYSSADFVAHAGIPCSIDAKHPISHNKVIIVDGRSLFKNHYVGIIVSDHLIDFLYEPGILVPFDRPHTPVRKRFLSFNHGVTEPSG